MSSTSKLDPAMLSLAWNWVLRLERSEDLSQDELSDWLRWYEADEAHKAAFDDMQRFWQQLDRVTDEPHPLSPALWLGELAESPGSAAARAARARQPRRNLSLALSVPRALAWSGGLLAAVLGVLVLRPTWRVVHPVPAVASVVLPARPAIETATLPDGSRVELAPKSSVVVQYTPRQRLLSLQRGEGYFIVAHNHARPFIVAVGSLRVRAVGTAFNVRSAGQRVVVTVAEGTVQVYPAQSNEVSVAFPSGAISVTAGSEVTWTRRGPIVASVDPALALGWRQGRLEYLDEPLASAVADLNRYRVHPVSIGDAAVGRIIFSGTVLTGNTDAWIASLPSLFPVAVEHKSDGSLVLVSRPPVAVRPDNPAP